MEDYLNPNRPWRPTVKVEWTVGLSVLALIIVTLLLLWAELEGVFKSRPSYTSESIAVEEVVEASPFDGHITLTGRLNPDNPITMTLDISDGHVEGTYRYKRGTGDIRLEGTITGSVMNINELTPEGRIHGTFEGTIDGDTYTGTFVNLETFKSFTFSVSIY